MMSPATISTIKKFFCNTHFHMASLSIKGGRTVYTAYMDQIQKNEDELQEKEAPLLGSLPRVSPQFKPHSPIPEH